MSNKKRYGLHCFHCGNLIYKKEDVFRNSSGWPICGECMAGYSDAEQSRYEEEQFHKQFPTDQDYIDYKYRQKYGEY